MRYQPHPASLLFPLMHGESYELLKQDIATFGLLEPIALHDEMILDGRNRARACEELEIEPRYEQADLEMLTPLQYVISKNLHRRHLTVAQRAAIGLELLPELEEEGRQRRQEGAHLRHNAQLSPATGKAREPHYSAKKAGEMVGVGRSTMEVAIAIQKRKPELIGQMRSGKIETVAEAARQAGYPRLGQSSFHGRALKITDANGKKPAYGKGDKWDEATTPLRRYLAGWKTRNFEFRHLNPREARRRLKMIEEIKDGIAAMEYDLVPRAQKATLRVED